MLDFLSQNRLVALGLLLIAVYGATTYMNSDEDMLSNGTAEQADMQQERVKAGQEEEPRPSRRPTPPNPEEFNDASEDGDEGLIDDTAGFDPSPEGDSELDQSPDNSDDGGGYIPTTGGSSPEGEVSVIVDNTEIESQFN